MFSYFFLLVWGLAIECLGCVGLVVLVACSFYVVVVCFRCPFWGCLVCFYSFRLCRFSLGVGSIVSI